MRAESDKRTVYKTDCSDSISLKKAYKEGKEILAKARITEADLDGDVILTYGKEAVSIGINGVFPNYPSLEAIKIKEGRFVNVREIGRASCRERV